MTLLIKKSLVYNHLNLNSICVFVKYIDKIKNINHE